MMWTEIQDILPLTEFESDTQTDHSAKLPSYESKGNS